MEFVISPFLTKINPLSPPEVQIFSLLEENDVDNISYDRYSPLILESFGDSKLKQNPEQILLYDRQGVDQVIGYKGTQLENLMKKLFVGSLSWNTKDSDLSDAFARFGEITEAKIITDRHSGRSRGFGFITFEDAAAADKAIEEMNGTELDGREITVNEAQEKRRDNRGGGGGGGGGGGRRGGGGYGGGGGGRNW